MKKKSPKIEAQVVEAIRRLQAVQGSTPQEISNYIAQEYNIPNSEIRPHVQLALKRGVTYGILQRMKGYVPNKKTLIANKPELFRTWNNREQRT
ncbi:hypothetical protein K0M31_019674 [Melipona bicolor]|uniref:H15 domain-containing protein n=1 Tax=Melipona bicolor TaxID=60889 RepID=A0AA40G2V3_9HYME|nr:hypothetical protein K0M31_019674 [Melipona bicolor]